MKKSARNAMLLALGLCVIGLVIAFWGILLMDFDFKGLDTHKTTVNTYTVEESFSHIAVMTAVHDVNLVISEDESCRVVCDETGQITYTVAVSNGTLTVRENDARKWYHRIGFHFQKQAIAVYLPRAVEGYGNLQIITDTGDVTIPEDLAFTRADIELDTGDLRFSAAVTGQLLVESDTGSITVSSSAITEGLSVSTDTGEITVADVTCRSVRIESDTGDVTLRNVMVEGAISIENDTGDVELIDCDAAEIHIETSTGDVTGILLSQKAFITETSTGDVKVPRGTFGDRCEIRTSTGDIEFRIKG